MPDVNTQIRYINAGWRDRDEVPSIGSRESRHANTAYQNVTIHDAREARDQELGLDTSGFTLTEHRTEAAGSDLDKVRHDYYPEMAELVKARSGADSVYVMAHQIRTEDGSDFNTAYAKFVHCDYNRANLQAMSVNTLEKHGVEPEPHWQYAWYNTWQPFDHEVYQNALAMCDARSIPEGDVIGYRYTGYVTEENKEGGLVAAPVYNPVHRWYYYPNMRTDELLLMKQLEGREGRAECCPHTSFIDASVPDDVPPRRSIELRLLAVFGS